jgi:hypothetical protein
VIGGVNTDGLGEVADGLFELSRCESSVALCLHSDQHAVSSVHKELLCLQLDVAMR